jgi:hypothetical protein
VPNERDYTSSYNDEKRYNVVDKRLALWMTQGGAKRVRKALRSTRYADDQNFISKLRIDLGPDNCQLVSARSWRDY